MATEIYSFLWEDSCSVSSRTSSLPVSVGLDCDRNIVVQKWKELRKFFIVDVNIAIAIYGESLLTANFTPCTVARGRTEMGISHMVAL